MLPNWNRHQIADSEFKILFNAATSAVVLRHIIHTFRTIQRSVFCWVAHDSQQPNIQSFKLAWNWSYFILNYIEIFFDSLVTYDNNFESNKKCVRLQISDSILFANKSCKLYSEIDESQFEPKDYYQLSIVNC